MVWISLQKIFCYVNKLVDLETKGTVPTTTDISTCMALEPSTDPLNLIKHTQEPEAECDKSTVTYQPGDSQWAKDEGYGSHIPSPAPKAAWKVDAGRSEGGYSKYIELEPVNGCTYGTI